MHINVGYIMAFFRSPYLKISDSQQRFFESPSKIMNEHAAMLAENDSSLLGNHGVLLQKPRESLVTSGYEFKNGRSRSQIYGY